MLTIPFHDFILSNTLCVNAAQPYDDHNLFDSKSKKSKILLLVEKPFKIISSYYFSLVETNEKQRNVCEE